MIRAQLARRKKQQKDDGGKEQEGESKKKKKVVNLNALGLDRDDHPIEIETRRPTLRSHFVRAYLTAMILKHQLEGARRLIYGVIFFLYIAVFTLAALRVVPGEDLFEHHKALRGRIAEQEWNQEHAHIKKTMKDIGTTAELWFWLGGPFLSNLIPSSSNLANRDTSGPQPLSGYILPNERLIGPIRLRQIRVRSDSCDIPEVIQFGPGQDDSSRGLSTQYAETHGLFSTVFGLEAFYTRCTGEFDDDPGCGRIQNNSGDWSALHASGQIGSVSGCYGGVGAEEREARARFGPIIANSSDPFFNMSMWGWSSAEDLNEGSYLGRSEIWYPGSGYSVLLPPNREDAQEVLHHMWDNNWMDLGTRAVFVDLMIYNPTLGVVTLAKVSFEFPPSGGVHHYLFFRSLTLDRIIWNETALENLQIEILLLVFVLMALVSEMYEAHSTGPLYLLNGWHWLSVVNYMVYLAGFALRVTPYAESEAAGFPPPEGVYVNYDHAFWASKQWQNCMAVNCIVVWFRAFQHLSFIPFMSHLVDVLLQAASPLMVVGIVFGIVSFAFSLAFLLAFGHGVAQFKNLRDSGISVSRLITGLEVFDTLWDENRVLGPLFFFSWTLIGGFFLLNLFIVVLVEAAAGVEFSMEAFIRLIVKFLRIFGVGVKRPHHDTQEPKKSLFSSNAFAGTESELETKNLEDSIKSNTSGKGMIARARSALTGTGDGQLARSNSWFSLPGSRESEGTAAKKAKEDPKAEGEGAEEKPEKDDGVPKLLRLLLGGDKVPQDMVELPRERIEQLEVKTEEITILAQQVIKRLREAADPQKADPSQALNMHKASRNLRAKMFKDGGLTGESVALLPGL